MTYREIPPVEHKSTSVQLMDEACPRRDVLPSKARRRRADPTPRLAHERVSREALIQRALFLPDPARTLVHAHFELGMSFAEIALLHKATVCQIRRRIERLRDLLSDPCFILALRFGQRLPEELADLAREHWLGGETLRKLAMNRGKTLYRVRCDLSVARSLLVVAMSGEQTVSPELARRALESRRGSA